MSQQQREAISKELDKITFVVQELDRIAGALYTVGNNHLADTLFSLSGKVSGVPENVRTIQHEMVMGDLNASNKALGEVLSAMIDNVDKTEEG